MQKMDDQHSIARKVAIVGIGATAAGGHAGVPAARLALQAFRAALDDAGMDKSGVQAILGGSLGGSTLDPEAFAAMVGLNPRVTSALVYASSAFTLHHAISMIAAGLCDTVACVFARNPPGAQDALSGGDFVYNAAHGLVNANAAAALGASLHMARYGTTAEHFGHVAVAARAHAQLNPEAAFRDPLSLGDYLAQPQIMWPFRRLDIALTNAAGVTIILARADLARDCRKVPVFIEAMARQQAVRKLQNADHLLCHAMRTVAQQVYGRAGLSPADIDALYIYDATTAVVLQTLENYGFCPEGEGGPFVSDGRLMPGRGFPVNTQGGHLSGGYLFGWLHHVEIVRQLRGEAGARQVSGAQVAQFCSTGRFREDYASTIFVRE
jgi:acetyl-CoA acetyltransferase